MNAGMSTQRKVRLIAVGAILTSASLFSVFLFSGVIHQFESAGPVEQWMKIGFERHHLEGLNAADVLISPEDYESERHRLLREEDHIVSDSDFPRDMDELARYKEARDKFPRWPFAFWIAFAGSVMTAIATVFWLQGVSFASSSSSSVSKELS